MASFPRSELEEMIRRFVAANDEAGRTGDWAPLAQFYAPDAIYSWNNGASWEFVARGRQQILDWVFGTEMEGLEKWTYPYVRTLIDEQKGEVIGIWRQLAPIAGENGEPYDTPKMIERLQKRTNMPGWVRRDAFDWYATIEDREA